MVVRNVLIIVIIVIISAVTAEQFTFFDEVLTHDKNSYAQPSSYGGPDNWNSPVNYTDGRVYLRYEALEKPSDKELKVQLCFWYGSNKYETCSPSSYFKYSTAGVYYKDLGTPNDWWQLNNNYDWDKKYDKARLMHKDASSGMLLMTSSCGSHCYKGGDIEDHVPIEMDATVIVVSKGATPTFPEEWSDCEQSWCKNATFVKNNKKEDIAESEGISITSTPAGHVITLDKSYRASGGTISGGIYAPNGVRVKALQFSSDPYSSTWDRRCGTRGTVPQGVYVVSVTVPGRTLNSKIFEY